MDGFEPKSRVETESLLPSQRSRLLIALVMEVSWEKNPGGLGGSGDSRK